MDKTDRERIAEITLYEWLTEDFVEPAANFYMTGENRERFYDLWKQFKKRLGGQPEPSGDRVEAVAKLLAWQDVRGRSDYQGKTKEQVWAKVLDEQIEDEYLRDAREILSLFPEPELRVLDDMQRMGALTQLNYRALSGEDIRWDKVSEVIANAQLAHDKDTLNKEAGK